jgi:hypothetical protein
MQRRLCICDRLYWLELGQKVDLGFWAKWLFELSEPVISTVRHAEDDTAEELVGNCDMEKSEEEEAKREIE